MRRLAAAALLALALVAAGLAAAPVAAEELTAATAEPLQRFPVAIARVETAAGPRDFRVWVADTPRRQAQGLMFVRTLEPDRGMFFPLGPARPVSFWMKNTYVSLDLVFIGASGRILNVAPRATPLSLEPIFSDGPAVAVLEVAAGTAARLGFAPGDRVRLLRRRP